MTSPNLSLVRFTLSRAKGLALGNCSSALKKARHPIRGLSLIAIVVALGLSGTPVLALADPAVHALHYIGLAYAADDGQLRYREEHWLFSDQGTLSRLVLYRCPSGPPFARKWVRYTGQPWMPEFALEDARDGYREGVHRIHDGWQVYVRKNAGAPTETAQLTLRPDTVIDAGFDAFVQARWNALSQPGGVHAAFVVPGRLGYLDLRLKPTNGAPAGSRRFHLSLDGWFGALAPSLELTYAESDHRLEQFVGISNIRDDRGHRQRVRIEFPREAMAPIPSPADISAAAQLPLMARCPR